MAWRPFAPRRSEKPKRAKIVQTRRAKLRSPLVLIEKTTRLGGIRRRENRLRDTLSLHGATRAASVNGWSFLATALPHRSAESAASADSRGRPWRWVKLTGGFGHRQPFSPARGARVLYMPPWPDVVAICNRQPSSHYFARRPTEVAHTITKGDRSLSRQSMLLPLPQLRRPSSPARSTTSYESSPTSSPLQPRS